MRMGILSNLLRRLRPLEIEDDFFGHLTYMQMPKGSISYWEAERTFAPTGRDVELFIDAPSPKQPPDELQRKFFRTVERRYESILSAVETVLRPQFEEWFDKPLSVPFTQEFTMGSFSIPHVMGDEAEWDMSFDSRTDAGHLFTVYLRGEHATGVCIDG